MRFKIRSLASQQFTLLPIFILMLTVTSCKKYLEEKTSQGLTVPSTLNDAQALLDFQLLNNSSPGYLELVADNYYVEPANLNSAGTDERLNYLWDRNAKITADVAIWRAPYNLIYTANFILDALPNITINSSEQNRYENIKGAALFFRGFQFYQLAQLFCRPYSASAETDLGIVLRLRSTVDDPSVRSTVQQTYDQIIADLKMAAGLLSTTSLFTTRPNKVAAYGALARVYLSMGKYSNAVLYADSALALKNTLLDFKSLLPANNPTLPVNYLSNPEVIFLDRTNITLLSPVRQPIVDTLLYNSYSSNDLRKTVFFNSYSANSYYWQGSYTSLATYYETFTGIATDEIYLIRAECHAKLGNKDTAMADLNKLLRSRWKENSFTDMVATDANDALNKVRIERRKELAFRGLRWTDLRRYNLEGAGIDLTRSVSGASYLLPANDLRWVVLIPELEVNRSGIPQNPR